VHCGDRRLPLPDALIDMAIEWIGLLLALLLLSL
jgi:hypothetical protein